MGTTRPVRPGWRAESRTISRRRGLRPDAVELRGQACPGGPEVEAGEGLEGVAQRHGLRGHERRQVVEDALLLHLDLELRLAPGVAQLDRDERLDEQRLAAAGLVMDDAPDLALGVCPDRDDVAAVAERDDGLLEGAAQLAAVDQLLQARAQPLVRDAHAASQAAQRRRGAVEDLARRIDAREQPVPEGRQRRDVPRQLVQPGQLHRPQAVGETARGDERVRDREQVVRVQPAATIRRG